MLGIIDLGISNIASVRNAFDHLGMAYRVVAEAPALGEASHILLPGVGAFPRGMKALRDGGFVEALRARAAAGTPILGICLGMQLLAEAGEEFEPTPGLGLLPGRVVRLRPADPALRLPMVGWNDVERRGEDPVLAAAGEAPSFYFVHGYGYDDPQAAHVTGLCDYGGPVVAAVRRGSVHGLQFHPEKSQQAGLAALKAFAALPAPGAGGA